MPIVDSKTGKIRKNYSVEELVEAANLMRGYNMISLCAAGSGHAGGTMSIMDVTAALYLHVATHDPKDPFWDGRDRIIWSTGHKAPSLYLGLGMAGYYDVEEVVKLRKLYSPFQGHPHWLKLPAGAVFPYSGSIRTPKFQEIAKAGFRTPKTLFQQSRQLDTPMSSHWFRQSYPEPKRTRSGCPTPDRRVTQLFTSVLITQLAF
jgi:transketolase